MDAQALSTADAEWIRSAIQEKNIANRQLVTACQSIDKTEVLGWITRSADQGNGASLMMLSLPGGGANNRTLSQRRLQGAVQAGFPEAEAFLAQDIASGIGNVPSGTSVDVVGTLLEDAAKSLPYAESELAICESTGCPGVAADIPSAVAHAREAAQRGSFDAMIEIGPKLQASQMDPNEVTAWNLVGAMLAQQGCGLGGLSVQNMTSWTITLTSKILPGDARSLAEQYWSEYGTQMKSNIGCSS